jgi:orotidine-5'-phosphate decarboxylase
VNFSQGAGFPRAICGDLGGNGRKNARLTVAQVMLGNPRSMIGFRKMVCHKLGAGGGLRMSSRPIREPPSSLQIVVPGKNDGLENHEPLPDSIPGPQQACPSNEFRFNAGVPNPLIVALDVPDAPSALALATQLAPLVGAFKIGSELFTSAGPDIVRRIRDTGANVFLDLKFHDIPNTVAKAVAAATRLDVQMLTVHTSGGLQMMQAAEKAAQETAKQAGRQPPLVLGVTVLTSMDGSNLTEIGAQADVAKQVERLATLAAKAGLRGLVCSPLEIAGLRKVLPKMVQLVTPGIRTGAEKADDQKRTLTPKEAIAAGANWLVVGRPIYAAEKPREAAEAILASVS